MWLKKYTWMSAMLIYSCVLADSEVQINRNDRYRLGRSSLSSSKRLKILHRHRRSPCRVGRFYCPEGYCIPTSWMCDRIFDCKNGEDEQNCLPKTSSPTSTTTQSTTSTTTQTTSSTQRPTTSTTSTTTSTTTTASTTVSSSTVPTTLVQLPSSTIPSTSTLSSSTPSSSSTSTPTTSSSTTTRTTSSTTTTTSSTTLMTSSFSSSTPKIFNPPPSDGCVARYNCSTEAAGGTFRSIPRDWMCDGENDCGDVGAEDETNCNGDCGRLPVELRAFCGDGQCISAAVQCNGRVDCADRSDELACYCDDTRDTVRCGTSGNVTSQCVDISAWCDGVADCADASDETLCNTALSCPRGSLRCNSSSECLAPANICDGVAQCADLRDETHCPCSDHYGYRCDSGACVRTSTWCNGIVDCPDASDEKDVYCRQQACAPNLYQCHNGRCLSKAEVCDGRNDCGDFSDEFNCECATHEFRCYSSGLCVDISRWCDGRRDCPDGSDESNNCLHECPLHWLRCDGRRCLSPEYVCDGHAHCINASDETNCNVSNTSQLWFDTSSEFLTVKFHDGPRWLVCANQWTQRLSDLVCIHTGCNSSINTSFAQPDVGSTQRFLLAQSATVISLLPGTCRSFRAVKLWCQCSKCGVAIQSTSRPSPWHVGLFNSFGFLCSAAVIDRRWVLTAAHCLASHTTVPHTVGLVSSLVNIKHLRIAVGLQGSRPSDNGRVTVSHVAVHPTFNVTDRSYDLALARLSSPLDFDDQVRPVCMPLSSSEVFATHSQCIVTGLAYTPFSGFSQLNRLASGDVKLLTYEQCANATSKYAFATLKNSSMICAALQKGPGDICFGDSSSLLVCNSGRQNPWTIVGLASWSLTNCVVTVYARTSSTVNWIQQTILTIP